MLLKNFLKCFFPKSPAIWYPYSIFIIHVLVISYREAYMMCVCIYVCVLVLLFVHLHIH